MKTISEAGIVVRPAGERGRADHGWLKSFHSFSFADYYDPNRMGFRSLRVINEDRVAPGEGFGAHPHHDMEIFTYVIEGALAHHDNMGHDSIIKAGEVQKITAGKGIMHSEYNASAKEEVHFYQVWIVPNKSGLTPSYKEAVLPRAGNARPLFLIGAPVGDGAPVELQQDAYIFRGTLDKGQQCPYLVKAGRGVWLQLVKGAVDLSGHMLRAGDGVSIEVAGNIDLLAEDDSEFLLFDLA